MSAPQILWMPNEKVLTGLDLPVPGDVPRRGTPKAIVFDLATPAANIPVLGTNDMSYAFESAFVLLALTAVSLTALGAFVDFRIQITHDHNAQGKQRTLFQKHASAQNVLGTAQNPCWIKRPYFFAAGDSATVEVRSLSAAAAMNINQVVFHGVDI